MNRRDVLATCGIVLTGTFAGCSSSIDGGDGTSERDEEVAEAVSAAETSIQEAFEAIEGMEVIVDETIGLVTDTKFAEVAETESREILEPLSTARERLLAVEEEGSNDQRSRVDALLELSDYAESKYRMHVALAETFTNLDLAVNAISRGDRQAALERAREARYGLSSVLERYQTAEEVLDTVIDGHSIDVPAFDPEAERDEQEYVATLVFRWEPGFEGLVAAVEALNANSEAFRALRNGAYETGKEEAMAAKAGFEDAHEAHWIGLDRGIEVYVDVVRLFACQSEESIIVAETLVEAARAGEKGDSDRAEVLTARASEQFAETERNCIDAVINSEN